MCHNRQPPFGLLGKYHSNGLKFAMGFLSVADKARLLSGHYRIPEPQSDAGETPTHILKRGCVHDMMS